MLCDCDGVLYRGTKAIPGSPQMIGLLKKLGKKVVYVTNNSARVTQDYVKKLNNLGFQAENVGKKPPAVLIWEA